MRAVIIATDYHPDRAALIPRLPAVLLPLVDRPFLQHAVEYLIDRGVTEFDFILSHMPEKIEDLLGDGKRWGSTFRYHLARNAEKPYRTLSALEFESDEQILLAHADRLPKLDLALADTRIFCWQNEEETRWTGWAVLSGQQITSIPNEFEEADLAQHLLTTASDRLVHLVSKPLSVRTFEDLLESQRRVLGKQFDGLMLGGREVEDRVWLSRNVSIHPTARIIPPVFIGENSRIGQSVQIGPNAAIGKNCVLDTRCVVADSTIFHGSFVGEALELTEVLVDRNRLVNVKFGVAVSVTDDFILGSMAERQLAKWVSSASSRVLAALLLAMVWPLLLLTAAFLKLSRRGAVLNKKQVVTLPTGLDEVGWQTFPLWSFAQGEEDLPGIRGLLLNVLPALVNVAKGELRFVGVRPRSSEEIEALPQDWRALYVASKSGIVTEAQVNYGTSPSEDELYSAEAFYSVSSGFRHDLKLIFGYLGRLLPDSFGARAIELQHSK